MATTERGVNGGSGIPNRSRRKTPDEIQGFQGVVLSPGGQVDVLNISNSGILVETGTRMKPGDPVEVCVTIAGASHVTTAKVVRSELTTVGGSGLLYKLALAFDEDQNLIDWGDGADDTPSTSDAETARLPVVDVHRGLQYASSPNRW